MEPLNATENEQHSKDEVDFIIVANNNNNNNNSMSIIDKNYLNKGDCLSQQEQKDEENTNHNHQPINKIKKKERGYSLFSFGKRSSDKSLETKIQDIKTNSSVANKANQKENVQKGVKNSNDKNSTNDGEKTIVRQSKFVKSASIARLLGNSNKSDKLQQQQQQQQNRTPDHKSRKFNTYGGRRRTESPFLERFKRYSKEDTDVAINKKSNTTNNDKSRRTYYTNVSTKLTMDSRDLFGGSRSELVCVEKLLNKDEDIGARAMRSLSRSLGKLWWRRTNSVDISIPDPEFKVSYLGNVLTGWAKGEGCVEKQLNTLWRNYTQNTKPDVIMRVKVCASGLKATTRQHGLTEYWANRITHCCAPANYPRVFCWVYRHEGRKMKHELRCHAVLCSKEKIAQDMCQTLKDNLERALREFKRDKILKQNARLSLANAAYDNPSLPRRKILLSVGGNNYRPPLERSKSAPKLMSIEEAIGEEEGEEIEETNEPEMKPCCQKDSLYPAMTLGRRRCRQGHSIRRTGKYCKSAPEKKLCLHHKDELRNTHTHLEEKLTAEKKSEQRNSYGSDESDDFEKILRQNNYDSTASLANELLPYFDMQLHKNNSQSLGSLCDLKVEDEGEPLSLLPTINSDPNAHPEADIHLPLREPVQPVGVRREGVCSDGEEDYMLETELDADEEDGYFQQVRQATVLNMLHRESMRKMAQLSLSSDEGTSSLDTNHSHYLNHRKQSSISSDASSSTRPEDAEMHKQLHGDSDEGSISSGCETSSIATANHDELAPWRYHASVAQLHNGVDMSVINMNVGEEEPPISVDEIYQRLESRLHARQNSDATAFSSSSSLTLKLSGPDGSPTTSLCALDSMGPPEAIINGVHHHHQQLECDTNSDSECSDESGYVEEKCPVAPQPAQRSAKPQIPPKPMPRRLPTAV